MPNINGHTCRVLATAVALAFLLALAAGGGSLRAATPSQQTADGAIKLISAGAESKFPEAVRFFAEVESQNAIQDIRVNFSEGARGVGQYNYIDLPKDATGHVSGEYLQKINTPDRYMPPGSRVRFSFEVTDKAGNKLTTDEQELIVTDARPKFKWETVSEGPITVYYSGPILTRAQRVADAANELLKKMAPVTGAETKTPVTVTLYANNADMIGAIQTSTAATARELVTEGQAFAANNVVLVLAGRRDVGTISHELTHVLVGRAAGLGTFVPTWLNEGLAEYGNLDPGISYDRFLDWGVDTNRITPLWKLQSFPGDPNLIILSYGQARSTVNYMITKYGPEKMAKLLATIGQSRPVESALQTVYGFGLRQLDAGWREHVGAEPYVEPTPAPTPTPGKQATKVSPTLAPYSLTPQAGQSVDAPTPTATAVPPTVTPLPVPEPTSAPPAKGGGCGRSSSRGVEASSLAGLLVLGAFAASRVARRRRQ